MAVELLGAKMLAPYFGSSLYVWSAILATTLFALTSGYFIGGLVSERTNRENNLYTLALVAAAFMMIMPFLAKGLLLRMGDMSLLIAISLSALALLFPPVFLMGMVSPLIISILSDNNARPGRVAGTVYAISTLGGILTTFTFGFFIIPNFGLSKPTIACGIILAIIPTISLIRKKKANVISIWLFCLLINFFDSYNAVTSSHFKTIYKAEGLLGQIMVVDYPRQNDSSWYGRVLMTNRIVQTAQNQNPQLPKYLEYISKMQSLLPKDTIADKSVLLLGLGGGSVATMLHENNFKTIDACELDERIGSVAKKYFDLPPEVNITVDDARHYINNNTKKYDVIIFDIFKGEENPGHVITIESLTKVKVMLKPDGLILINNNGYISGAIGQGTRSLVSTIENAGFFVSVVPAQENEKQADFRNLIICASPDKKLIDEVTQPYLNTVISKVALAEGPKQILTDEKPVLDVLNAEASKRWRYYYIQKQIKQFNYYNVALFD